MKLQPHVKEDIKGAGWGLFWWTLAIGLHVTIICLIVYWKPLREWYVSRSDPEAALSGVKGPRMQQVLREMLGVQTRRLREQVAKEDELRRMLDTMRDSRYVTYRKQAKAPEPLSLLATTLPSTPSSLDSLNYFELYDVAQQIERKCFATYREMRIVELARIQSLTFANAADVTNVALPRHEAIDYEVFSRDITGPRDPNYQALLRELEKVRAEVASMISGIQRLIDVGHGLLGDDVGGIMVIGAGGTFEGGGSPRWGSDIGPSLSPDEFAAGNRDGDFPDDFSPLASRKLMDDGRKGEWMYLDTWYVIGPFPNPNREYMDKVFPPESVVDLDRTYVGKDGRKLTWQWTKSKKMMIAPPVVSNYAVWYAFTEVYADRPQEKWVAFGSDDYSKCWLNGELVWTSGKTPHKWIPDRGFRKLKLQQGHNKILVKLENAGGTTGFSVIFYTGNAGSFKPSEKAKD